LRAEWREREREGRKTSGRMDPSWVGATADLVEMDDVHDDAPDSQPTSHTDSGQDRTGRVT